MKAHGYKVEISEKANEDIRLIYQYIADQLSELWIASKQYRRIKEAIMSLSEMPHRGALYSEEPWRSRGLRKLVIGNYLAFYFVEDDAKVVVVRVMYGGRNVNAQLEDTVGRIS